MGHMADLGSLLAPQSTESRFEFARFLGGREDDKPTVSPIAGRPATDCCDSRQWTGRLILDTSDLNSEAVDFRATSDQTPIRSERASMAWKRSSVRIRYAPPSISILFIDIFSMANFCNLKHFNTIINYIKYPVSSLSFPLVPYILLYMIVSLPSTVLDFLLSF